ncbi:MAG: hypothetical protein EZS28_039632, partial [Streblomastix strix]
QQIVDLVDEVKTSVSNYELFYIGEDPEIDPIHNSLGLSPGSFTGLLMILIFLVAIFVIVLQNLNLKSPPDMEAFDTTTQQILNAKQGRKE